MDKELLEALGLTEEEFKQREKEFLVTLEASVRQLRYRLGRRVSSWRDTHLKGAWERNHLHKVMADTYYSKYLIPEDFPITFSASSPQDRTNLQNFIGAYLLSLSSETTFLLREVIKRPLVVQRPLVVGLIKKRENEREKILSERLILYTYLEGLDQSQIPKDLNHLAQKEDFEQRLQRVEEGLRNLTVTLEDIWKEK